MNDRNLVPSIAVRWDGIFPLKSADAYQDKLKRVCNHNFFRFHHCKSVNTSLLRYPCVFCLFNDGDGRTALARVPRTKVLLLIWIIKWQSR